MKSETLSLKTIIKELDIRRKTVTIQWDAWKKKFIVALKQINWKNTLSLQWFIRKENAKSVEQ